MEIDPSRQAATGQPGRAASSGPAREASAISSDFDTFIRMLTTQIRNQDPLNPMDSADFAVQLATFSSVEQQVKTNDLLTELGRQNASQSVAQLSAWIGKEARALMPAAFEGNPVAVALPGAAANERLELVATDARGNEVQRLVVPRDGGDYLWTGRDTAGNMLPAGRYTLRAEAYLQGSRVAEAPVAIYGRVAEVAQVDGKVQLTLANGQKVSPDDVLGLRAPQP